MILHWIFTTWALSAYFFNIDHRVKLAALWVFANFYVGGIINSELPDDFIHVRIYLLIDLLTGAAIVYVRGPWLAAACLIGAAVIGELTVSFPGGFFDRHYHHFYLPVNLAILLSLTAPRLWQVARHLYSKA